MLVGSNPVKNMDVLLISISNKLSSLLGLIDISVKNEARIIFIRTFFIFNIICSIHLFQCFSRFFNLLCRMIYRRTVSFHYLMKLFWKWKQKRCLWFLDFFHFSINEKLGLFSREIPRKELLEYFFFNVKTWKREKHT